MLIFTSLFQLHPEIQVLFGLSNLDSTEDLFQSKRFRMQARYMIQMLDSSVQMLGPDIELLTEINHDLGKRHVRYGVTKEMYFFMGEALIYMLEQKLGDDFTKETREAWEQVYAELAGDIMSVY